MKPSTLDEATCLLSPADCQNLLEACNRHDPKPDAETALGMARRMIGGFRASDIVDPAVYVTIAAALFAEYPASIGRAALDPIKGLPVSKYCPSPHEIKAALEDGITKRRAIAYRAQWMLDEHKRREEEASRTKPSPERRAELVKQLQKAFAHADVGDKKDKRIPAGDQEAA